MVCSVGDEACQGPPLPAKEKNEALRKYVERFFPPEGRRAGRGLASGDFVLTTITKDTCAGLLLRATRVTEESLGCWLITNTFSSYGQEKATAVAATRAKKKQQGQQARRKQQHIFQQ